MRKELLKKRSELRKLANDINQLERTLDKDKSIRLNQLKKESIKKYQFINNLLKVM